MTYTHAYIIIIAIMGPDMVIYQEMLLVDMISGLQRRKAVPVIDEVKWNRRLLVDIV